MGVEDVRQVGRSRAPVGDEPAQGRPEEADVPFAQFSRPGRTVERPIEPDPPLPRVERKRGRCLGTAPGSRTLFSHESKRTSRRVRGRVIL